jgi:hypothetical protein
VLLVMFLIVIMLLLGAGVVLGAGVWLGLAGARAAVRTLRWRRRAAYNDRRDAAAGPRRAATARARALATAPTAEYPYVDVVYRKGRSTSVPAIRWDGSVAGAALGAGPGRRPVVRPLTQTARMPALTSPQRRQIGAGR